MYVMTKLDNNDLAMVIRRIPRNLVKLMKDKAWSGKILVGGGFIRSVIKGEHINDVDVFCPDPITADHLAKTLAIQTKCGDPYKTDNSFTLKTSPLAIQIIHRWTFQDVKAVADSFDFTICCAAVSYNVDQSAWVSYCDPRFYTDLAGNRLVYRSPVRNEDAGGSMLRVLKYYQKGYRIPLNSLGAVIARLVQNVDTGRTRGGEQETARIITGLLREVDPNVDPDHIAHLPAFISAWENV